MLFFHLLFALLRIVRLRVVLTFLASPAALGILLAEFLDIRFMLNKGSVESGGVCLSILLFILLIVQSVQKSLTFKTTLVDLRVVLCLFL